MCCCLCHASHIMSSCALHLHTCSSHASEHFPRCPFCIPALRSPPVVISTFLSCVGIKHFRIGPRLAKRLGLLPVDRLSSFVSFGLRLILQRLTEGPKRPRVCCSPTPPPIWTKTHLTLLHHLGRSITIAWPKTAPYLDSPSSLYLYISLPLRNFGSKPSKP